MNTKKYSETVRDLLDQEPLPRATLIEMAQRIEMILDCPVVELAETILFLKENKLSIAELKQLLAQADERALTNIMFGIK